MSNVLYSKILTAAAVTSTTYSASSFATSSPELYDVSVNDLTTGVTLSSGGSLTVNVLLDVKTPNANTTVSASKITVTHNALPEFNFIYGSNDGTTWTYLSPSVTVTTVGSTDTFTFPANQSYQYYQCNIGSPSNVTILVSDVRIYDATSAIFVGGPAAAPLSIISGISVISGISSISF